MQASEQEMAQNYGNFSTIVMAVVWIYYLVCSFLYGASISNIEKENVFTLRGSEMSEEEHQEVLPEIPNTESTYKSAA